MRLIFYVAMLIMFAAGIIFPSSILLDKCLSLPSSTVYISTMLIVISLFSILIIIASIIRPEYSARIILLYGTKNKMPLEKRKKRILPFLTKQFAASEKLEEILLLGECKLRKCRTIVVQPGKKCVETAMKNGIRIELYFIKNNRENSTSRWALNWLLEDCTVWPDI